MTETRHPIVFPVHNRTYCVWNDSAYEQANDFLTHYDVEYFRYVAAVHETELDGDGEARAALALRVAYHHGLEALFTLLLAYIQAPHFVLGWSQKSSEDVLEAMVASISGGAARILNPHGLSRFGWVEIAQEIHAPLRATEAQHAARLEKGLASVWTLMAHDFVNEVFRDEYNALKHGLRVRPKGVEFGLGEGDHKLYEPGRYGCQFSVLEPALDGFPGGDCNTQTRRKGVNFTPLNLVHRLELIGLSISNVVAALKHYNRVGKEVLWQWPSEDTAFDLAASEEVRFVQTMVESGSLGLEPGDLANETKLRRLVVNCYLHRGAA